MRIPYYLQLLALLLLLPSPAQEKAAATVGPESGSLMVIGGGGKTLGLMMKEFIRRAGGTNAHIVAINTAKSSDPEFDYSKTFVCDFATRAGCASCTVLHTHDREEADTAEFVVPLKQATGVWFSGGRQWRFVKAYGGTRTEKAIAAVLGRGGVIAGSSAGATIQGSFLARGDTKTNTLMIGDVQRGFGYLRNCAIDQHLIPRRRQLDMIKLLEDPGGRMKPTFDREALLGIGIDENAALIVEGDMAHVFGDAKAIVHMYNPREWTAETKPHDKYLVLKQGQRYDLAKRKRAPRDLFLLIGQSNMAGRATIEAADREPIANCVLWREDRREWVEAKPPYNLYSAARKDVKMQRLNSGPSFARSWRADHPDVAIGIICAARGGTSIREWSRDEPAKHDLYPRAVAAARHAMASGGRLAGILWHQGESDSSRSKMYPAKLAELVANLREDLDAPEVPFVFGQLGQWDGKREKYAPFNAMITKQVAAIPHSACVTTEELTAFDGTHFDTASQRELGTRYAAALLKLKKAVR